MLNKTKVCLVATEFPPDIGGIGHSVHRIAKLVSEIEQYEVHVAVFETTIPTTFQRSSIETAITENIYVHRIKPSIREKKFVSLSVIADFYHQLERLHELIGFNLFHSFHIAETGFIATLLAKEKGIGAVCSARGADLHQDILNPTSFGQISWTLENSDELTFVSQAMLRKALVVCPNIANKSRVIWNSVAPIDFDLLPKPKDVDKLRGVVIGSLGSFRYKKGIEYLLDACENIASETQFTLLLIGDFVEREREYWKLQIKGSKLKNKIVVTGFQKHDDAMAYLKYVDIFVLPSIHDGCPNAILEAMIGAKPIIATGVGAIGEILEANNDAILVQAFSSLEIANGLKKFIHDPDRRKKFGQQAKNKAVDLLSPSVEQAKWVECYESIQKSNAL
jgi:L-malate glycosyltransferase